MKFLLKFVEDTHPHDSTPSCRIRRGIFNQYFSFKVGTDTLLQSCGKDVCRYFDLFQ